MGKKPKIPIGADATQLLSELTKTDRKFEKLKDTVAKLKAETKQGGKASKDAFGSGALSDLRNYALGAVSVGAAVGAVKKAWDEVLASGKRALANIRETEFAVGEAGQLAGAPGDVIRQEQRIAQIRAVAGMPDRGKAAGLFKTLASSRQQEQWQMYSRFHRFALAEQPKEFAEAAAFLRGGFKGEAGTIPQITAGVLTAAEPSLAMAAPSGKATGVMGPFAHTAKVPFAEAVATLGTLAESMDIGEAGTAAGGLFDVMFKKGLTKGTVPERLRAMHEMTKDLTGEEYVKFFGRKQARQAFGQLQGREGAISALTGRVRESMADPFAYFREREEFQMESPRRRQLIEGRLAETALAIEEDISPRRWAELEVKRMKDRAQAELQGQGRMGARTALAAHVALNQLLTGKTGEPARVQSVIGGFRGLDRPELSVSREEWDTFADKIRDAVKTGSVEGTRQGGGHQGTDQGTDPREGTTSPQDRLPPE